MAFTFTVYCNPDDISKNFFQKFRKWAYSRFLNRSNGSQCTKKNFKRAFCKNVVYQHKNELTSLIHRQSKSKFFYNKEDQRLLCVNWCILFLPYVLGVISQVYWGHVCKTKNDRSGHLVCQRFLETKMIKIYQVLSPEY